MALKRFRSAADVIAFAIDREIRAAERYGRMADLAGTPGLREMLLFLRGEEESHRRLLEGLTSDQIGRLEPSLAPDLGLVDDLADEPLAADMSLQELLIYAARKEKQAVDLYEALARTAEAAGQKDFFLFLAGQERDHKLKLETAYETHVLPEN